MRSIALLLLLLIPVPPTSVSGALVQQGNQPQILSSTDRQQGAMAAQLAGRSAGAALHWLSLRHAVSQARLGADGHTIDVHFRDATEIVIVPKTLVSSKLHMQTLVRLRDQPSSQSDVAGGRAAVLEPFADELQLGSTAGQAEAGILVHDGFSVDAVNNGDVTVRTMESLSRYSVVYLHTHSGVLPDGDAVVATGEVAAGQPTSGPYGALYRDHSLLAVYVAGDPTHTLYNAITARFVAEDMGTFPSHSIMFLNGCSLLSAPRFWDSLRQKGVSTMISWDHEVNGGVSDEAARFVLTQMDGSSTVAASIAAARTVGISITIVDGTIARLGFLGDGDSSFTQTLPPTPPMPTITPQPTPTPQPTRTPRTVRKTSIKCKGGKRLVHGKCRSKRHRCLHHRCRQ